MSVINDETIVLTGYRGLLAWWWIRAKIAVGCALGLITKETCVIEDPTEGLVRETNCYVTDRLGERTCVHTIAESIRLSPRQ
jgi:hypothetical protein